LVKLHSLSFLAYFWLLHYFRTLLCSELIELLLHEWLHLFLDLQFVENRHLAIDAGILLDEFANLAFFHEWKILGQELERVLLL